MKGISVALARLFLVAVLAMGTQVVSASEVSPADRLAQVWLTVLDWLQGPEPEALDLERIDLPHQADSPFYGEVLFQLYQHHDFEALTELTLARRRGQWVAPAEEATLLRASLDVSWGLHDQAAELYRSLPDSQASAMFKDRAWLYLAKARYQRGWFEQADEALHRVGGGLAADDQDEFQMLKANLLMEKGNYAAAATLLAPVHDDEDAASSPYSRYNLGVALMRSGQDVPGREVLDELGVESLSREDELALRDRANLDLGIYALRDHDPERARFVTERIRLHSPYANQALLVYGWSMQLQNHPREALAAWEKLAATTPPDAAVIEAMLAMPVALAQEGAKAQALDGYHKALAFLDKKQQRLDAAMQSVKDGTWIDAAGDLPRSPVAAPPSDWSLELAPVLASSAFQAGLQDYHDLRFLDRRWQAWSEKLQALKPTLAAEMDKKSALLKRIDQQRLAFLPLLSQQKSALTSLALAQLQQQKESLQDYGNQARFGIARLYDESAIQSDAHASGVPHAQ